jgi:Glutamate-cysteine ligase family 2(GCS2)
MAVINAFAEDAVDRAEPLTVAAAYAQCRDAALAESAIGAVGLEIESHLVDLDHVADPVPWKRVEAIAAVVGQAAPGSAVTVEPGGQIELSGPPAAGVAPAVARLRYEGTGARLALADRRLGLAYAGADPARPSRRVNPRSRYRAMEQHFAATGRAGAGRIMMNSTPALQVNLQAGPPGEWPARVARAYRLGPTLVAIAASSPWLHGRDTGWKSVRQRAWSGLDPRTCGPVPGCAPRPGRDEALDPASAGPGSRCAPRSRGTSGLSDCGRVLLRARPRFSDRAPHEPLVPTGSADARCCKARSPVPGSRAQSRSAATAGVATINSGVQNRQIWHWRPRSAGPRALGCPDCCGGSVSSQRVLRQLPRRPWGRRPGASAR